MKLSLLRQWEQTARSLSVAESEGMGGGEENMLGRVELAIPLKFPAAERDLAVKNPAAGNGIFGCRDGRLKAA